MFFSAGSRQQRGQQGYSFRLGGKNLSKTYFFQYGFFRFLPWFFPPPGKNLRTLLFGDTKESVAFHSLFTSPPPIVTALGRGHLRIMRLIVRQMSKPMEAVLFFLIFLQNFYPGLPLTLKLIHRQRSRYFQFFQYFR